MELRARCIHSSRHFSNRDLSFLHHIDQLQSNQFLDRTRINLFADSLLLEKIFQGSADPIFINLLIFFIFHLCQSLARKI